MPRATATLRPNGDVELRFPFDPLFVERLKALPPHARKWCPELRCWWVASPYVDRAAHLFEMFFPDGEFVDAPGFRARASDQRVPPPPRPPDDPYRVLHLLPSAPLDLVEAAGRTLAKLYHPDKRPEGERALATVEMQRINGALDRVRRLRGAA